MSYITVKIENEYFSFHQKVIDEMIQKETTLKMITIQTHPLIVQFVPLNTVPVQEITTDLKTHPHIFLDSNNDHEQELLEIDRDIDQSMINGLLR